jgi:hypothetical protein
MKMQTIKKTACPQPRHEHKIPRWFTRVGISLGAVITSLGLLIYTALADDPPVLTISNLGSNNFSVTITNATNLTNDYLLEWTPILADTNYPWLVVATNEPGATNWIMDMGAWPMGYLRVAVGWDGDGDLVPSWKDANPYDPSIGILSVTIDSPLNGSSIY